MAVETKIGLLVGLAFIVCFGVILSHRGNSRTGSEVALDLLKRHRQSDGSATTVGSVNTFTRSGALTPPGTAGTRQRATAGTATRQASIEPRVQSSPAGGSNSTMAAMGAGSDKPRLSPNGVQARPEPRMAIGMAQTNQTAATMDSGSVNRTAGAPGPEIAPVAEPPMRMKNPTWEQLFTSGGEASQGAGRIASENLVDASKVVVKGDTHDSSLETNQAKSGIKPETRESSSQPGIKGEPRQYVVETGDTLWRIADKVYGKSNKAVVDAIFNANKDRMATKEKLVVGMQLMLPELREASSVKTEPPSRAKSKKSNEAKPAQFYQVQMGDRYATIAEKLLGDKGKWKDIYEMNKDIFPEPGKIRPGVRIRVPGDGLVADAR